MSLLTVNYLPISNFLCNSFCLLLLSLHIIILAFPLSFTFMYYFHSFSVPLRHFMFCSPYSVIRIACSFTVSFTDIKNWMTTNKLKLNGEKTEIMILSNKSKTFPINLNHLNFAGEEISIPSANVVRNLEVYFDSNLTMESHIKKVTQSCHFQLKNIGKIRDLIDNDIAHMLVHSFVTSRLDFCNCLYAGVPFYLLERLQKIQNKAARLVLRKDRKHDSKELLRLLPCF